MAIATMQKKTPWDERDGIHVFDTGTYRLTVQPSGRGYGYTVLGPYYPILRQSSRRFATTEGAKRAALSDLRSRHKRTAETLAN